MAIKTINKLPVYEALVTEEETGIMRVSLVDDPAVDSNFIKLAKERAGQLYRVQDEEKRLVRGVIMRADFPIFRSDDNYGEYYVIYHADTIRVMAEKYLAESRQNDVNLMHEEGSDVEGVRMVQWFIKDSAAGIAPEGFADIEDGSLFAEYHVTNDDVWEQIKAGTFKGFSLEGVFELVPQQMQNQTLNNEKIMVKKTKLSKVKAALAKAMLELGSVTTDRGILSWDGDEDLKAGDAVYVEDEDGNRVQAEDGDYKTDDNKTIKVADGKVTEIVDPEAEVDSNFGSKETDNGVLEWNSEADLKAGDSVYVQRDGERVPAPDGDYKTSDGKVIRVKDGKVEEIVDDEAEVASLREENERMKNELAELKARDTEREEMRKQIAQLAKQVEQLMGKPMTEPATIRTSENGGPKKTGNKGLDRLAQLADL